jgi:hypothetical protein
MALATQNERMFPIASAIAQNQMRRSLVGALVTDPIVPERPPRTRRPTIALNARPVRQDGGRGGACRAPAQPHASRS